MIYEYDLTVPANTLATAPAALEMALTSGIIHKLDLTFPAGCRGQVLLVLRRGLHQVSPANADGRHKADGYTISYPIWYPIEEPPYVITAEAWSPGTSYQHVLTIRLGVERREVLLPAEQSLGILDRIGQIMFGRR